MKKVLQNCKTLMWVCCLILMGSTLNAQNEICTTFENGTNDGWAPIASVLSLSSPALDGSTYLRVRDASGGSWAYNSTSYPTNWEEFNGACLCFDYKVYNDGHAGSVSNINPKIVIYQGTSNNPGNAINRAVFVANVVVTELDDWVHVCAPIEFISGTTLPSNGDGQWTMSNPANWNTLLSNIKGVAFGVDIAGSGAQTEVIGIDNICIQECDNEEPPTDDGAFCCNDEKANNLVTNGNFEFGNTGFSSAYTQSTATNPGEYDVTTSAAAFGANVTDQSFCTDSIAYATNDMFMVVNGKTQQSGSSVVWEQTIQGLEKGQEYKFCANFKDMEQCTFNIYPDITISAGSTTFSQIINTDDTDPCDWERIEICFIAEGPKMILQIELDETGNGDGNDLAIDDISVQEKLDPEYFLTIQHQGNNNDIIGSLNTISNTDDTLLNEECVESEYDDYYWFVYETTLPTNPPFTWNYVPNTFAWSSNANWYAEPLAMPIVGPWGLTTNFPDYPFASNKFYVIGMWIPSCCESCYTESWEYQITYNNGMAPESNIELTDKMKAKIKSKFVIGNNIDTRGAESNESLNTRLNLFPNPARNSFDITLEQDTIKTINVISITGQLVFSEEIQGKNQKTVDISNLTSGMYFVKVVGENQNRYTAKLVKE